MQTFTRREQSVFEFTLCVYVLLAAGAQAADGGSSAAVSAERERLVAGSVPGGGAEAETLS